MNEVERVDTRVLKTGQLRLRFRLTKDAYDLITMALSKTPYSHSGAALDAIAMSYHAGTQAVAPHGIPAAGGKRLLVRLFPDQFENVRSALDIARESVDSDADALLQLCIAFLAVGAADCNQLQSSRNTNTSFRLDTVGERSPH